MGRSVLAFVLLEVNLSDKLQFVEMRNARDKLKLIVHLSEVTGGN